MFDCNNLIITQEKAIASIFINTKKQLEKVVLEIGEGRPDVVARLCMVVDWCIDHPEYTAKIKVIPKKDYPILMPCEF